MNAEEERDAALAVIAKVWAAWLDVDVDGQPWIDVMESLAAVDTSALAARDAAKWDEANQAWAEWLAEGEWQAPRPRNPYRALVEGADQ